MPRINQQIAAAFFELADLLEMTGEERFRVLAYRRAAETIEGVARDLASMSPKDLVALRGIGAATAKKISEFAENGTIQMLEEVRAAVPKGVRELTRLSGLGPKKAMLLNRELGIESISDLRKAIKAKKVREVKGLGPRTEVALLDAINRRTESDERVLLGTALKVAEAMVEELESNPAVERAAFAGSLRRMKETIGDVDVLVASNDAPAVMEAFAQMKAVQSVEARGPTKSTVIAGHNLQVDLRVVAPDEFGAAMQYFTGSKQHNVKVREHAVRQGYKLSEYGLFRVSDNERVASATEDEVYGALGMETPLPTMREDRGEVELALEAQLPKPIEIKDIKGELHGHSRYSDGRELIITMAKAAADRGYKYWTVTDHGPALAIHTLTVADIAPQAEEVATANEELAGKLTVLQGVELNVSADGEVDFPDDLLEQLDVRVASVHGAPWDYESMTHRVLNAVKHPLVNILGHPTGRRLGRRPAAEFDFEAVFQVCAENHVALEVNSNPQRLDLKDDHLWLAREFGCKFVINTDAHSPLDFENIRLGVATAQRGWVTADDVINTWPLAKLRKFLAKKN